MLQVLQQLRDSLEPLRFNGYLGNVEEAGMPGNFLHLHMLSEDSFCLKESHQDLQKHATTSRMKYKITVKK